MIDLNKPIRIIGKYSGYYDVWHKVLIVNGAEDYFQLEINYDADGNRVFTDQIYFSLTSGFALNPELDIKVVNL